MPGSVLRCTVFALLGLCGVARADTIEVPADAPTIPAAIARAQDGDRILVAPGTWAAPVDFLGKALTLTSSGGHGVTTIDGGDAPQAVRLGASAGTAVLEGFTVLGGIDARVVLVEGSATVSRCRLLGTGSPGGNGITLLGQGNKLIADCRIAGNRFHGVSTQTGALNSIERCLVESNGGTNVTGGGGIDGYSSLAAVDCIIRGNLAQFGGGATRLRSQKGCRLTGNVATVSGGAYSTSANGTIQPLVIEDSAWIGNHAPLYGGGQVQSIDIGVHGPVILRRCVLAGNTDDAGNVGLHAYVPNFLGGVFVRLEQCTVLGDRIEAEFSVPGQPLQLTRCIVRSGPAPFGAPLIVADHCDIEGGWPGAANFDADPQFVDAAHDVHALLPGSPCVDAGGIHPPLDPDGSPADVGAFPLSPFADAQQALFGSAGLPGLTGSGTLQAGTPVGLQLVRARPLAAAALVIGLSPLHGAFKGGVFVPTPLFVIPGLPVNAAGELAIAGNWPAGLPSGLVAWAQYWIPDNAADHGFAASNGLGFVVP